MIAKINHPVTSELLDKSSPKIPIFLGKAFVSPIKRQAPDKIKSLVLTLQNSSENLRITITPYT